MDKARLGESEDWMAKAGRCEEAAALAAVCLFMLGTGSDRRASAFSSSLPAGFDKLLLLCKDGRWVAWARERAKAGSADSRLFQLNHLASALDMERRPLSAGKVAGICAGLRGAFMGMDEWSVQAALGGLPAGKLGMGAGESAWRGFSAGWEVDCEMAFELCRELGGLGEMLDAFSRENLLDPSRKALLEKRELCAVSAPGSAKAVKPKGV